MITLSTHRRGTPDPMITTGTKLFIHGLLGSGEDWNETIKGIGSNCTCVTADLPAHGKAPEVPPTSTSFEGVIHEIGGALTETLTKPLHGIGYSLGGRVLLGLTQYYPELFERLTFISTFPGFESESIRHARWESDLKWSSLMGSLDTDTFLTRWYAQETFHSERWNDETRAKILSSRSSLSLSGIAPFFEATSAAKMPSYWSLLDSITIPTRFIAGERDLKYVQIGQELAERNPSIHPFVVPGCGHAVPLESPVLLAKAL